MYVVMMLYVCDVYIPDSHFPFQLSHWSSLSSRSDSWIFLPINLLNSKSVWNVCAFVCELMFVLLKRVGEYEKNREIKKLVRIQDA